jgi:hypothetical protein
MGERREEYGDMVGNCRGKGTFVEYRVMVGNCRGKGTLVEFISW